MLRALRTVLASRGVDVDIVLVDNASGDGTVEAVRAAFLSVRIVANADNRGFTAANNQAFGALGVLPADGDDIDRPRSAPGLAPPPYTMLLNPDTEVPPDALAALVGALDADAGLGAVGPRLRYPDGAPQPSRYRDPTPLTCLCESTPLAWHWPTNPVARRYHMADVPDDRAQDVDWLNGAALVVRTDALRAAGGRTRATSCTRRRPTCADGCARPAGGCASCRPPRSSTTKGDPAVRWPPRGTYTSTARGCATAPGTTDGGRRWSSASGCAPSSRRRCCWRR
ncbi:MAG: glycosyltransferase [Anaerolineae bacterium]